MMVKASTRPELFCDEYVRVVTDFGPFHHRRHGLKKVEIAN
jgi:hypothetical protein